MAAHKRVVLTLLLLLVCSGTAIRAPAPSAPRRRAPNPAAITAATVALKPSTLLEGEELRNYLLKAAASTAAIRGTADVCGQLFAHSAAQPDLAHALHIASISTCVSGVGGALWQHHLEQHGPSSTVAKTLTDYTCWAPLANSAYLFGMPLLAGASLDAALHSLHVGFSAAMSFEALIFAPYNLYAFKHVHITLRPLVQAALSAVFTVLLATLC